MTRPATTTYSHDKGARKFLIHGNPGTGKSPLAMSLPWGIAWGEKAVLVATDRKEVCLPCPEDRYIFANYAGAPDPYTFIKEVLEYDWRADGAGTIIIDTGTVLARDYLAAAIRSGGYNAKAVTFGTNTFKLSDKPHYGLAHTLTKLTLEAVKRCPLNVIMTFWSDYLEPSEGGVGAWGGPLTINMNESRNVAGEFANILYCRTANIDGKTKYLVHTENCGIWVARLNGVLPNPIPQIEMQTNPTHVWEAIDKVQKCSPVSGAK